MTMVYQKNWFRSNYSKTFKYKNTTPTSIEWRSNSRKCLEVLYGNAYWNKINIPQAAFEVTPRAFSEMPNTEIRTEFLLIKNSWNFKKTIQTTLFTFCRDTIIEGQQTIWWGLIILNCKSYFLRIWDSI
jgi:hypothetical protein